jgi:hypothetical protein
LVVQRERESLYVSLAVAEGAIVGGPLFKRARGRNDEGKDGGREGARKVVKGRQGMRSGRGKGRRRKPEAYQCIRSKAHTVLSM